MVLQPLAPRVEDHQPANGGTQALRIPRDLEQGVGGRLKQQVVHHALVDERETGERLRHREDDVDVADREQLLLASRDPRVPRRGQTLRAMPIATAVVREGRLRALVTAIAVPAERGGADTARSPEGRADAARHPGAVLSRKRSPCRRTMSATSKGGRVTACATGACGHGVGRETDIASSGLATACRCRCDKCR